MEDRLWIEGREGSQYHQGLLGVPHTGDPDSDPFLVIGKPQYSLGLFSWLSLAFSTFSNASTVCCQSPQEVWFHLTHGLHMTPSTESLFMYLENSKAFLVLKVSSNL